MDGTDEVESGEASQVPGHMSPPLLLPDPLLFVVDEELLVKRRIHSEVQDHSSPPEMTVILLKNVDSPADTVLTMRPVELTPQMVLHELLRVAESEVGGVDELPEEVVAEQAGDGSGDTLQGEDVAHGEEEDQLQTQLLPRDEPRETLHHGEISTIPIQTSYSLAII